MQKYTCHKTVEAFKITHIERHDRTHTIIFGDETGDQALVYIDWMLKHNPQIGGYFVRYSDGYESYSPAKPFESGYTLAEDPVKVAEDLVNKANETIRAMCTKDLCNQYIKVWETLEPSDWFATLDILEYVLFHRDPEAWQKWNDSSEHRPHEFYGVK